MRKGKADRKRAKGKAKSGQPHTKLNSEAVSRRVSFNIQREIDYITKRAQAKDARLAQHGGLVFFSTQIGDAWMLDTEDSFAACVCRHGHPQLVRILESAKTIGVDWPCKFAIEGDAFVICEKSGRLTVFHGYPLAEIAEACGFAD
jgi:hypothetical protein